MSGSDHTLISIVIPVHNEEKNVTALFAELQAVTEGEPRYDWEFIFVDDGSRDQTSEVVSELARQHPGVRLIRFTRNFGHQVAISAGMDAAMGRAVITMDGDMQHPPKMLPEFLRRWENGAMVVVGIRIDTAAGFSKKLSSRLFYTILGRLSEVPLIPNAADFRLLDRQVADIVRRMPERARFVRGMVGWTGFHIEAVPYEEAHRKEGVSKFSFFRMLYLASDALTSFSALPLRFATIMGFASTLLAMAYGLYALTVQILYPEKILHGWTSTIFATLFIGGVQLVSLGIIGEYVHRIYDEVKGRPLYLVKQRVGFPPENP
jgi:dolichol-phosphate mannosyltransferase